MNFDPVLGGKYPHRKMLRSGAKLVFIRGSVRYGHEIKPHWRMYLHLDCANGDGGVVYEFVRKRSLLGLLRLRPTAVRIESRKGAIRGQAGSEGTMSYAQTEPVKILIRRSLQQSRKRRSRAITVYAENKYGTLLGFRCAKADKSGAYWWFGDSGGRLRPYEDWPQMIRDFVETRVLAPPKASPKRPADKSSKLAAAKRSAEQKLDEWNRKATMAASKVRLYSKRLRSIERQIAAQQTAGIAGASSRSFAFDE